MGATPVRAAMAMAVAGKATVEGAAARLAGRATVEGLVARLAATAAAAG